MNEVNEDCVASLSYRIDRNRSIPLKVKRSSSPSIGRVNSLSSRLIFRWRCRAWNRFTRRSSCRVFEPPRSLRDRHAARFNHRRIDSVAQSRRHTDLDGVDEMIIRLFKRGSLYQTARRIGRFRDDLECCSPFWSITFLSTAEIQSESLTLSTGFDRMRRARRFRSRNFGPRTEIGFPSDRSR